MSLVRFRFWALTEGNSHNYWIHGSYESFHFHGILTDYDMSWIFNIPNKRNNGGKTEEGLEDEMYKLRF